MKLSDAVTRYVTHKRSMGQRFTTEERTLKSFSRAQQGRDIKRIGPKQVLAFLAGHGPPTRFWHRKHEALSGFYRFAISHGYVDRSPLPKSIPKLTQRFVPYVYSQAELKRLLDATEVCFQGSRCLLDAATYRTLLLLLYGAALRISEAVSLTVADVDLDAALLNICESKFYTSRLVPISTDLVAALTKHLSSRRAQGAHADAPLFVRRSGDPMTRRDAESAFCRLRVQARVLRSDNARYQPRLHDLRHSAATHRLLSWYQNGADVQRMLPQLATYLGHIHIAGTQHYLSLTPQLLQQASQRFERYALGGRHE